MQINDFQKYLKVTSILNIIDGSLTAILGALSLGGGVLMGVAGPAAVTTSAEAATVVGTTALASIAGIIILAAAAFTLTKGILGLKTCKDASKVTPLWWFAVIGLALSVLTAVSAVTQGTLGLAVVLDLALSGVTFWAANGIKNALTEQVVAA